MDEQKIFINTDGIAIVKCPSCGKTKNLQADRFREKQHALKVHCICGHAWRILLDFRGHYRKDTDLSGIYTLEPPAMGSGSVTIINISRSGVGCTITGLHAMKTGQKARLHFTLDDKKQTAIDKRVIVRAIRGNYVGCEFFDDRTFEKDIGFYLQP